MFKVYIWLVVLSLMVGMGVNLYFKVDLGELFSSTTFKKENYLVKIGTYLITQDLFEADFKIALASHKDVDLEEENLNLLKKSALRNLILRKLQIIEINKEKFVLPSQDRQQIMSRMESQYKNKEVYKEQLAGYTDVKHLHKKLLEEKTIEAYLETHLLNNILVTDSEIAEYYQTYKTKFISPERVRARQILLDNEKEADRLKLDLIRNRRNGGYFGHKARQLSIAPEGKKGGDLGWFARGEMPSLFNMVFSMRENQIRGVIKSNYGYHIIQRTGFRKERNISLKAASKEITAAIKEQKRGLLYKDWIQRILLATPVTYHQDFIYLKP